MIKLKRIFFYNRIRYEPGDVLDLDKNLENILIKNGTAEPYTAKKSTAKSTQPQDTQAPEVGK